MNRSHRWIATFVAFILALSALPAHAADAKGVVNLNTATTEQLTLLPRVGPAVAQRILEHREKNGAFKKIEELMLVKGIGEKTFELLQPYLAVSGATTLSQKVRAARPASSSQAEG